MLLTNFFCRHFNARNNYPTSHTFSYEVWRTEIFWGWSWSKIIKFCKLLDSTLSDQPCGNFSVKKDDKSNDKLHAKCHAFCHTFVTRIATKRTNNLTINFPKLLNLLDEHTQRAYKTHNANSGVTPDAPEDIEDIEDYEDLIIKKTSKKEVVEKPETPDPRVKKKPPKILYSESFLEFYELYPLRASKKAAANAWKNFDRGKQEELIAALQKQILWREQKSAAGEFVSQWPHPSTWLNGERWTDELKKPEGDKNGNGKQQGFETAIQRLRREQSAKPNGNTYEGECS